MADERILAAVRRFIADKAAVEAAYLAVFTAWTNGFTEPVVITSKSSGEDAAAGEITVRPDQFVAYMEVLEARLQEYEAEEAEEGAKLPDNRHTDFSCRYARS